MSRAQTVPESPRITDAEAFFERIAGVLDAGAAALMLSIGHRCGLLDTLAGLDWSSSRRIAKEAGLAERYVREWLAAMVVAGIVAYDPEARTYRLPPEHAACLTRDAALGNLAVYAQFVAMAGAVEERVLECFATGGGVGYEDYPCFHRIMAEDSAQTVVAGLPEILAALVPDTVARLTAGIDVLDAGCGSGKALAALAARYPSSRFTGYDLCDDAIAAAAEHAASLDLANVRFATFDLAGLDERDRYHLVTSFDAVHDTKDPARLLCAIHRALAPGGVHLMQDIGGSARLEKNLDFPFATLLYAMSTVHCTPVSLAQGGEGLGTMWGWETAERMLREAGFADVRRNVLPHDPMNVWFVSRKG